MGQRAGSEAVCRTISAARKILWQQSNHPTLSSGNSVADESVNNTGMNDTSTQPMAATPAPSTGRFRYLLPLLFVGVIYLVTRPSAGPVGWADDYGAAMSEAVAGNKHVLVAFYMEGCPPCYAMDRTVLPSEAVTSALEQYVPVRLDVDRERELANRFQVIATPTFAVVDAQGRLVARTEGFLPVEEFVRFLGQARMKPAEPSPQPLPSEGAS